MTVNLTNMLVLTTIFISVMQTLPKTAYVKHIDIWLIFCQLIPFIEVLLITAAESLREGDKNGEITYNHHGHTRVIQTAPEDDAVIKAQEGKTTKVVQVAPEHESVIKAQTSTGKSTRDWILFAGRFKTQTRTGY